MVYLFDRIEPKFERSIFKMGLARHMHLNYHIAHISVSILILF